MQRIGIRNRRSRGALLTWTAAGLTAAALITFVMLGRPLRIERIDLPVPAGSLVPQLSSTADGMVVVSWLEPRRDKGYRFRFAMRRGSRWSEPVTVDNSPDVAMFSADLPGVAQLPGGSLLAYWERADTRARDDPYATVIQLSRSADTGKTWLRLPSPHGGEVSGEHSFVSAFSTGSQLGLVWLDARNQRHVHSPPSGAVAAKDEWLGAIGLRYAALGPDGEQVANTFIDPVTCECCPTSAAVTARGPAVVYRGRASAVGMNPQDIRYDTPTVRDIYLTRLEDGRWTTPHRVWADNWVFNGCPDNGPAVDAAGDLVVVAWWTESGGEPTVKVAFSYDAGDTFKQPVRISRKAAEGQVTVALTRNGQAAIVGWLEEGQTWARRVTADGRLGAAISLGPAPRHARLPRWIGDQDGVLAVWSQQADGRRTVHMARLIERYKWQ